jgi:CMP-N-acetylneuraminic acid synthetase
MIRGKTLTAVIPARAGSKGIKGKNHYKIDGDTLVERSIKLARGCSRIDSVYVTTDDPSIYEIAENHNAAPPSLRPKELASDTARTIDAVKHLLGDINVVDGYILLLQVTTPLRTAEDLENLIDLFEQNAKAEAITSVVNHTAPHPDKLLVKKGDFLDSYSGKNPSVPRQSLPVVYALNGAFYLTSVQTIMNEETFLPGNTIPYEMPPERSINLDEPLDLLLLEAVLAKNKP